MKHRKITIVRDPRTTAIRFLDGQPRALEGKMTAWEWKISMNEINEALKDRISLWSSVKNISVFLFLMSQDQETDKIDKAIDGVNERFKGRGIIFCNPKRTQYQILSIIETYSLD